MLSGEIAFMFQNIFDKTLLTQTFQYSVDYGLVGDCAVIGWVTAGVVSVSEIIKEIFRCGGKTINTTWSCLPTKLRYRYDQAGRQQEILGQVRGISQLWFSPNARLLPSEEIRLLNMTLQSREGRHVVAALMSFAWEDASNVPLRSFVGSPNKFCERQGAEGDGSARAQPCYCCISADPVYI